MEDSAYSGIDKASNLVSRNRPVALIAGACTLVGSHLAHELLKKGIQIIAVDDLTASDKRHVAFAVKNKDFHLINLGFDSDVVAEKFKSLNLPRLDYGFFIADKTLPEIILGKGIINFIALANSFKDTHLKHSGDGKGFSDKPRLTFVSSINLYGKSLSGIDKVIKESEVKFAHGIKHYKLNGRVVRLAEVFGPGMELDGENPLSRLIVATIHDKLADEKISLDFTERSLYVDDAVSLIVKAALAGSTSNKIYDGALLHPLRLSEIKQILADPVWSEENPPLLTKLPAWPTPNLVKTMKELSWKPAVSPLKALRETVAYFKENQQQVPNSEPPKPSNYYTKNWSFAGSGFLGEGKEEEVIVEKKNKRDKEKGFDSEFKKEARNTFAGKTKRYFWFTVVAAILIYGLVWPGAYLGYQAIVMRSQLLNSKQALEQGDFSRSEKEIEQVRSSIENYQDVLEGARLLEKIPGINQPYNKIAKVIDLAEEGVDGVYYATRGSRSLFETTKIISGESRDDPRPFYENAQRDLDFAGEKLSKVYASLEDPNLKKGLSPFVGGRIDELRDRLGFYLSLVERTKSASELMPKITGLDGKRSYLVLLQNNLELRPTGGFIGSYAKLDFDNGRLTEIKVDDIYNLDGALKEVIAPPQELRQDLGVERLYLRDSNFEPDFPTSARQASFFYRKEAGEAVHGVIALDLKASGNLLDAVGGLDLPEYGESVNGSNLFERAITHAEANFFPGSQAKKNYLTSLQNQLFNKIFYLSKQNWPGIIQAISKSLEQKHMLVYLEDPTLFSYLASSNWSGVFPRAAEAREGETNDFLAVIESNMGANKSNYFLQRKSTIDTSFTKEGKVMHKLKITYKNTSPADVFPAGKYKNRIKIYTPLGSKLAKATLGETDITSSFSSFSDYGRTGFSALIEIMPKEQKILNLEYELADPLSFKDDVSTYRMEIFKQPGIIADPLDFVMTYPINFKLEEKPSQGSSGVQEVKIETDMQTDRVFQFKIRK